MRLLKGLAAALPEPALELLLVESFDEQLILLQQQLYLVAHFSHYLFVTEPFLHNSSLNILIAQQHFAIL